VRQKVPFLPRFDSFENMPSRSRNADTRGTLIIPQNSFFGYAEMNKRFVGIIFGWLIRCE